MSTETPNTMSNDSTKHPENDASQAIEAVTMNAQTVLDYLTQHPEFFDEHKAALSELNVIDDVDQADSHQGVTSLMQRQADVLRKEKATLNDKLIELIDTAKQNESLYNTTHDLVLHVLEKHSLSEMLDLLNSGLTTYFDIQCSRLILLDSRFDALQPDASQSIDDIEGSIQSLLNNKQMVCGSLRQHEYDFFFPSASELASAVVYPLCYDGALIAVFAMGSEASDHFVTGSDSTLIDFLSRVIEINLNRCLQTSE